MHPSRPVRSSSLAVLALALAVSPRGALRAQPVPATPRAPLPAAVEARLATLALGPYAAAVRAVLAEDEAPIRAASIVARAFPHDVTVVEWDDAEGRSPSPYDPRSAEVFFPGGHVGVSGLEHYGPDPNSGGDGNVRLRVEGPITVEGDPTTGVATVLVDDRREQAFWLRGGHVSSIDGASGEIGVVRLRLCGITEAYPSSGRQRDPATLRESSVRACLDAVEALRDAVRTSHPEVRAATAALDRVAPVIAPDGPRIALPSGAPCVLPDAAAMRRVMARLPAVRARDELGMTGNRSEASSTQVEPSNAGCVEPRTGAFVARTSSPRHNDAVLLAQRSGLRAIDGWGAGPTNFGRWIDVDLNGDGALDALLETVPQAGAGFQAFWRAYTHTGAVDNAHLETNTRDPLRVVLTPTGNAVLFRASAGLLRLRGRQWVAATGASFDAARAAAQALAHAEEIATQAADALDPLLAPPDGVAPGTRLAPTDPRATRWSSALVARLVEIGVDATRARALVDAVSAASPAASASANGP